MKTTCDICKIGTDDLGFDDVHGAMKASTFLYAFMCADCRQMNDGFWNLSGVAIKAEMEISMNRRYFNRIRKEINNV